MILQDRRAALIVAHPGHELRVYQWLKLARPLVFVLTDGSGRSGKSRIHQTTRILSEVGATLGDIYGRMTDAELYAAIIQGNINWFVELAVELAHALRREAIDYVVGDALEGYNPAHDLCRYMTNAAILLLARESRAVDNFDVLIASGLKGYEQANHDGEILIDVAPIVLEEKVRMAGSYTELEADVQRLLRTEGIESLKTEHLRRLVKAPWDSGPQPPFYEIYGQRKVEAGHYRQSITYREHVRPIAEALRAFGEKGGCS
jgi:hypothetical protein